MCKEKNVRRDSERERKARNFYNYWNIAGVSTQGWGLDLAHGANLETTKDWSTVPLPEKMELESSFLLAKCLGCHRYP